MARSQGRFKLDGIEVEHRSASFSKEFDVDPDDIDAVSYDQTLVMVVVCRVGAPRFKETAAGELKRIDNLEIGEAAVRVAKGQTGYEIADMFGIDVAGQFDFEPPDPLRDGGEEDEPEETAEPEDEPEAPEPDLEPEPEPQPAPAKAASKKAAAKKASGAKKAAGKRGPAPAAPTSSLVGQHVGGAAMNDERLRDFMSEPV